jgi:putative alpha-1,2-mannosidase
MTVLDPATVARQIRSLIDTYRHEGWLPGKSYSLLISLLR